MRRRALGWAGLFLACLMLTPSVGRAQDALGYALPDTFIPTPLSSTRPEEGFFFGGDFALYIQTNPMGNQVVARRGFIDVDGSITGTVLQRVGSFEDALNTHEVTGPQTQQPGFKVLGGYRFYDGGVLELNWLHISTIRHTAVATILPLNLNVGGLLENSFLSSPVRGFPSDFAGPANDVNVIGGAAGQVGDAFGVWNAADLMTIDFTQRFDTYELIYRLPPIIENYTWRTYNYFGPRFVWFWENFTWRTFDQSIDGQSADVWNAFYTNIISNRMYGIKIGCGNDCYIGNGLSVNFDLFVTPMIDFIKKRAKYERGDRYSGAAPERKRADIDYTFVPEFGGSLNLNWFPYEGIQVKAGYNILTYLNTVSSRHPIDFDYNAVNPTYDRVFRMVRGLEIGIAIRF